MMPASARAIACILSMVARTIEKHIRENAMMIMIIKVLMNIKNLVSSLILIHGIGIAAIIINPIKQIHHMLAVMIVNRRTDAFSVFFPCAQSAFNTRNP